MAAQLVLAAAIFVAGALAMWAILAHPGEGDIAWIAKLALLSVIGLVMGGAVAYVAKRGVGPIVEREHRHDERDGDRRGEAATRFGRLVRGQGRSTRPPMPFVPETPRLAAAAIFAHAGDVNLSLGTALSSSQPPAVNTAVLGALLGLAARGRCALLLGTTRTWSLAGPGAKTRSTEAHTWTVQRVEGARERAMDEGWVESALLAALDALAAETPSAAPGVSPYRTAGTAPSAPGIEGAAMPVPALIRALTGGREHPRSWLKGILRREAGRRAARGAPDPEVGAALGQELASIFYRDRAMRTPLRALLVQVGAGLAGP
jgi:hypothetical protein